MKNLIISLPILIIIFSSLIYFSFYWKPKQSYIDVTIKLLNKCEDLVDDAFMVVSTTEKKSAYFIDGIAKMILEENSKIRLEASLKYPGFAYDGIPKRISKEVTLVAECTTSDRLEGIFDSMREQFNSDK